MTKEEIIEMAKKAGLAIGVALDGSKSVGKHEDKSFAVGRLPLDDLETFAKLVAEKEREACAEICDGFYLSWIDIQGRYEFMGEGASECAGAIRARGQE